MSQENVDVVRNAYAAFGSGDMDALGKALANTEWYEADGMPYAGVYHGFDAIAGNVFGPITTDVEGFTATPEEILDAGDEKVVSIGRYHGTGANGPVDVRYAHVWTIKDGAIAGFAQHCDTKVFGEAVGK